MSTALFPAETDILSTAMTSTYHPPVMFENLLDALVTERRLLEDLAVQMRRQRSAVGSDDIDSVDESVFATHRILATLGQARQRRRQINELLGGSADMPLKELEMLITDSIDDRFREARSRLQMAAETLTREVGMNRKLLREALAQNSQHVKLLTGDSAQHSTYAAESAPPAPAAPRGLVVNRTA